MFVRILRGGRDALYQCDRIRVNHEEPDSLLVEIESDKALGAAIAVLIDKKAPGAVGVYAMNDMGQTVDTIFRTEGSP